jgi:carboxylate-amine ligase
MPLSLFSAVGLELELMLVDHQSLDLVPKSDALLASAAGGSITGDVERGTYTWSNELVLHVLEIKTTDPYPLDLARPAGSRLADATAGFHREVLAANELAARHLGARLLGGGMHPWMDPFTETRLWPHDYSEVYAAFDRIFGARGHGWSNLQSLHLNLPFANDQEFARLHAAVRLVLPLLPALSAASPVHDGRLTGLADSRLEVYRHNARRIPQVAGWVIPEQAWSEQEYRERVFAPLMDAIRPHDPDGIFEEEWLNARGAIARFSRGSIEIRVLDAQECPAADLAIAELALATLLALVEERWAPLATQQSFAPERLQPHFLATLRDADQAAIADRDLLACFGLDAATLPAGAVWRHLAHELIAADAKARPALDHLLERGPLARRIRQRLDALAPGSELTAGSPVGSETLRTVWRSLAECLTDNRLL